MKHFYTCLLLILGVALLNSFGLTVKADDGPTPVNSSLSPEEASVPCMAGEPVHVSLSCFRLSADSGSLLHDMTLQASVLPLQGGAMMHSGMHNVSDGGDGVRLLPGGTHFAEQSPALITLAYNPMRIPAGYTANDIYTYCCEQTGAQWYRLERIGIDTVAHTVSSLTTHFTDFANAVISVPDLPESNAYVPTTLTDIPDPDPLYGIPMVHVNGLNSFGSPTGDNSGSASLTYPIDIPAGRHGLQPDVNLYYNSANGNGPLGVGWSIPTPNVTVDTRWGVPRYNAAYETEAYLVNGEPIVRHDHHDEAIPLPHQSSQFLQRNFQTERFWFRDTRNATRVIRHGRFPNEYWWEVTTTNGITYYYGRTFDPTHPDHDAIDENSVLRGMYGNIGYWALTAMVDLYGNYVLYKNSKHCGLAPYSDGCNIYTDSILYTGNCQVGTAPAYAVELVWMNRNDVISDGRLGLLRLTDRLLCHVDVTYRDTVIGSYYMNYECSANSMWKNRLASIDKSDELGTQRDCNYLEHNLPYYQEYAGSRTTFGYRDAPQDVFGTQSQISNSNTHINKSTSGSWNIGGTATVGIGPMPFNTNYSAGGNYNYSQNYNQIESMLLDLNGDGLPDLVYKAGNVVKYRPQQNSGEFGSEVTVSGLSRLSRDVSRTHNWGLQVSFVGALSYSNPITLSYTDYYFSDINADGLPDMVTPDGILFNHLTPQGHPSFSPYTGSSVVSQHNAGCPGAGIHYTGTIDERLDCEVQEVAVDSLPIGDMHDPGWTEPVFQDDPWHESGELVPYHWDPLPTGNRSVPEQAEQHDAADSYRANANVTSASEETTPASHTSDVMDDVPDLGNRVFFEDGYTYRVERGKIIKYGIETICHDDNPDPIIETVRVWVAEERDTIQVNSSVSLLEDNSVSRQNSRKADGVRCIIQRNTGNHANETRFTNTNATILHAETIAADDYDPKTYASSDIIMEAGDMLLFRLCSGNNASFDSVNWNISIQYSNTSGTHFSNSAEDYICTGNRSFAAPLAGEAIIRYKADNDYSTPISLSFAGSGKPAVILAANSSTNGAYIAFDTISMQQGDTIKPVVGNANTVWSHVHIYPEIEFHYQFTNPATNQPIVDTTFFYPDVDYPCSVISTNNVYRYLFGKLHKGWGRFAYRPRNNSNILDLCSLVNTERQAQLQATQSGNTWQNYTLPDSAHVSSVNLEYMNQDIFSYNHLYNPIDTNNTWIPVYPDSRTERWIPYGNLGYISKTGQSNSRNTYPTPQLNRAEQQMAAVGVSSEGDLPYYDSAIPLSDGTNTGRNKTIRKSTRSVQHSFSGGAVIMNASNTWGTYSVETDFMDLNGDGFPDAVGPSGVQYSLPWGGLGSLRAVG